MTILAKYVEAESGKGGDALERRPQLAAALAAARSAKCSVLVSKLDRLSRDVAFAHGDMAGSTSDVAFHGHTLFDFQIFGRFLAAVRHELVVERLPLIEGAQSRTFDCRDVDEHIFAAPT